MALGNEAASRADDSGGDAVAAPSGLARLMSGIGRLVAPPRAVSSRIPRRGASDKRPEAERAAAPSAGPPSPARATIGGPKHARTASSPSKIPGAMRSPSKHFGIKSSPSKGPASLSSSSKRTGITSSPSKLARFRETNWASVKSPKKRPRDVQHADSALPPPKRLDLGHLPPQQQQSGGNDADALAVTRESAATNSRPRKQDAGEAPLKDETESYEQRLQRKLQVSECLEQDLMRDNARMKLKAERLREDVDYYYHLLVRIEQLAAQARGQSAASTDEGPSKDMKPKHSVAAVAERVQRVISGSKSTSTASSTASPAVYEDPRAPDDVSPAKTVM